MTYSIVARAPDSGEFGVAVQSHWFSVGAVVPWAQPGVGAVATQSIVEVTYGPRGLELMASGTSAADALAELTARDEGAAVRQVAMIDAAGLVATHTGADCVGFAGHVAGHQVSCQANMMRSADVWPAMLAAYESTEGSLARRLLAALEAAEAAGGDARGKQSAALLVVPASGEPWQQTVSLRVEDDAEPLPELRRLLDLHEAYTMVGLADECSAAGRHDEAAALYQAAARLAPGNHELRFWAGLGAAQAGDWDRALAEVQAAIAAEPGWRGLLARLPPVLAPDAAEVLTRIEQREAATG